MRGGMSAYSIACCVITSTENGCIMCDEITNTCQSIGSFMFLQQYRPQIVTASIQTFTITLQYLKLTLENDTGRGAGPNYRPQNISLSPSPTRLLHAVPIPTPLPQGCPHPRPITAGSCRCGWSLAWLLPSLTLTYTIQWFQSTKCPK